MILIDHEDVERSFNFFLPVLGNSGATTCSLLFQRRNSFYFQKSLLTLKREPSGNGIYIKFILIDDARNAPNKNKIIFKKEIQCLNKTPVGNSVQ